MPIPEDILCCPSCHGRLERDAHQLRCRVCAIDYHKLEGFWDLLPETSSSLKASEGSHYSERANCYLNLHESWSASPFYRHYHNSFLDDLRSLPQGSLVLETGCGLGHDGLELLRSGLRLVETDIALGELKQASRLHAENDFAGRVLYLLADAENLPFTSGSFDGAFMVASLHHLQDPLKALREMRRVLRAGGVFVLGTEPNSWQNHTVYPAGKLLLKIMHRLGVKESVSAELVSEADKLMEGFSGKELMQLFHEAGFGQVQLKPAGYLSAVIFFLSVELSFMAGRNLRMFPLERLAIPLDELLARTPLVSRYPWHWNAVAS